MSMKWGSVLHTISEKPSKSLTADSTSHLSQRAYQVGVASL